MSKVSTAFGFLLSLALATHAASTERLRLIIETDAGGDPDDEQSLVRFLLYANEWDIEGIIANRPTARDGKNRNPERTGLGIVRRLLKAYGDCQPNLAMHDPRYPALDDLWQRTVAGHDRTDDAVNLIIAAADKSDPRPLWYSDWGTDHGAATNNLRRALDRVPTGMNDPEQPTWGSWAGRYGLNTNFAGKPYFWANQLDAWNGTTNLDNTVARWAADLQNDFRARLDWCLKPFAKANHPPAVIVNGSSGKSIIHLNATAGVSLTITAEGTTDPDKDKLTCEWFAYPEAGTYPGRVRLENVSGFQTALKVPADAADKSVHLVLAVRDNGNPPFAAYRRAWWWIRGRMLADEYMLISWRIC